MHMLSKEDVSSGELETSRTSRITTTVITANVQVQTCEKAQVYVHDLELFVTVQIHDDTLDVLSLGKLCEEHGYTTEGASGQKPHLTKDGKKSLCKTENFVLLAVTVLSSSSSTSSSSTSPPQDSSTLLKQTHSRSNEEAPGNWRKGAAGNRLQDLLEWLEDFAENLDDAEMPAAANVSLDSDPERLFKVAPRKHSIDTHFPKDPKCEVCKRIKITRAPCRRRTGDSVPRAEMFGDLITVDYKDLNEGCESRNNHR